MKNYNATVEVARKGSTLKPDDVDQLVTDLVEYHPAVGTSPRGWLEATISLPAASVTQATTSAVAVVQAATGREAIAVHVMSEQEFDERVGFVTVPSLIGTAEVAEILGVSPQRVRQLVDEGRLQATPVGKSLAFPRYAVEAFAAKERTTGRPAKGSSGAARG